MVSSTDSLLEFSNNTPSHFKVRLNKPLVFQQSEWKVGLATDRDATPRGSGGCELGVIPNYHGLIGGPRTIMGVKPC